MQQRPAEPLKTVCFGHWSELEHKRLDFQFFIAPLFFITWATRVLCLCRYCSAVQWRQSFKSKCWKAEILSSNDAQTWWMFCKSTVFRSFLPDVSLAAAPRIIQCNLRDRSDIRACLGYFVALLILFFIFLIVFMYDF